MSKDSEKGKVTPIDDNMLRKALRAHTPRGRLNTIKQAILDLPDSSIKAKMLELAAKTDERLLLSGGGSKVRLYLKDLEGLRIEAFYKAASQAGGKATASIKKETQNKLIEKAIQKWNSLSDRPERDRCGIIAEQLGVKPNTVRGWIRKAGLRQA